MVPPHPEAADALQVCIEQTRARRQRPLVDADGAKTVTTHRFRHTVGTQLAEEGARIQTIMAILGHTSPAMSLFYARITDTAVLRDYQAALQPGAHLAGPAAEAIRNNELSQQAVEWLASNYYKTALELGHCLRLPEEGPCECDLFLTCSKFFATAEYAPRLRERSAWSNALPTTPLRVAGHARSNDTTPPRLASPQVSFGSSGGPEKGPARGVRPEEAPAT